MAYTTIVTKWDNLSFTLNVISQDIFTKTTTLSWSLKLVAKEYGAIYSSAQKGYAVVIDGQRFSGTTTVGISNNSSKTLASGSIKVPHNSNGTKTISFSYSVDFTGITFSGSSLGPVSDSGTMSLPTITQDPIIISAPDINDETNSVVMKYANVNTLPAGTSVFVGITTDTQMKTFEVPLRQISNSSSEYRFNLTSSEKEALFNGVGLSDYITIFYRLIAYTSTNAVYSKTYKMARYTILDAEPLLNPTVEDTNSVTVALTGNKNVIVKNASNAYFVAGAQGVKGATIKSQNCDNGFQDIPTETGTFEATQSGTFKFWARDTRNLQVTKTITKTTIDYFKPTCKLEVSQPDSATDTTLDFTVTGNWFNGSFGAKSNTLTIQYRYKVNNGSFGSWTTVSSSKKGNTYTASGSISGFVYSNSYTVEARAKDRIYTIANTDNQTIAIKPVFDWSSSDFNFNVPVKINEVEMKDFVVEEGEQYGWYYRKWDSGAAECWYTATVNNIDVGEYQLNGFYYCGSRAVSFPFTFTKVYYTSATGGSTGYMNIVRPFNYTNSNISYVVVGMQDVSSASVIVNLEAKGRWK